MKVLSRGFTLVELMIVIAIIGILAAALFPTMSGYLSRSRDTARISHIGQLITAATTYYGDTNSYSGIALPASQRCTNTGKLAVYMNGRTPVDRADRNHCGVVNGNYGVGTGNVNSFTPTVAFSAVLENEATGNTGGTVLGTHYQGTLTGNMIYISSFSKGTGSGYVIAR